MQRLTRNNIFANKKEFKEEKFRGNSGENELTNLHTCVDTRGRQEFYFSDKRFCHCSVR